MSDLIAIGRSGVLAYRDALSTTGENVVNANTDGYAKRQVALKENSAAAGPMFLSRNTADYDGVQAATVTRVWDQYRASTAWSANSDDAFAGTRSQYLSTVETTLNDTSSGVGVKLTAIFTSANALAASPSDTTLRQSMLYALQDASGALGQTAANLGKVSDTIAQQANSGVDQLNSALAALAKLNVSLKASPTGTAGHAALEDQRDALIGQISGTVGVDVTLDQYGAATLKLGDYSGMNLVSASSTVPSFVNLVTAGDGRLSATVSVGGDKHAASITSGSLAGLIDAAGTVADRTAQLDGIAHDLATSFTAWQAQGTDANGNAGAPLLTGTTAATLALATTDPQAIAAAKSSAANGNLLALADLRGSGGVEAQWKSVVADNALQVASAKTAAATASTEKDNAYTALDGVAGVDLDGEAADLLRFQQAYSASSKIIQAAQQTFQSILSLF